MWSLSQVRLRGGEANTAEVSPRSLFYCPRPRAARRAARRAPSSAFHPGVTRANNAILGLFGTPAGNVTVASGFAVGTADLVIDVTGWWR